MLLLSNPNQLRLRRPLFRESGGRRKTKKTFAKKFEKSPISPPLHLLLRCGWALQVNVGILTASRMRSSANSAPRRVIIFLLPPLLPRASPSSPTGSLSLSPMWWKTRPTRSAKDRKHRDTLLGRAATCSTAGPCTMRPAMFRVYWYVSHENFYVLSVGREMTLLFCLPLSVHAHSSGTVKSCVLETIPPSHSGPQTCSSQIFFFPHFFSFPPSPTLHHL